LSIRLGVDLDNVISSTDVSIRALIYESFGVQLEQSDIVDFDYWRCGISREQSDLVLHQFHRAACADVAPLEGSVSGLQRLSDDGAEISIVTSRPPECRGLTEAWLQEHAVPHDRLIFERHKQTIAVDLDGFIEDHRETAYLIAEEGARTAIFDYPWNQPMVTPEPGNIVRVYSWLDVCALFEQD